MKDMTAVAGTRPMQAAPDPAPPKKTRGNPNLALAPRCGARTRAGCPCRSPAVRGKQRCRMHGGRSTGPRTAEGLARLRAAHTTHGRYGADWRAHDRLVLTRVRRMRVLIEAIRHRARLPTDLLARLDIPAPELRPPPWPTGGLSRAEDRAMMHAEATALAPWKTAIAAARLARRSEATAARQPGTPSPAPQSPLQPHAPEAPPALRQAAATLLAPVATECRAPASRPLPPGAPSPASKSLPRPHAPEAPSTSRQAAATPHAPEVADHRASATRPPPAHNPPQAAPDLALPVTAPHAPVSPPRRSLASQRRDYLLASGSPIATFHHWCTDPRYRRYTPRIDFSRPLPSTAESFEAMLPVRPAAPTPHPVVRLPGAAPESPVRTPAKALQMRSP